eukprot:scaffold19837_cov48-Phaeocystis_antarctica.AAC.2
MCLEPRPNGDQRVLAKIADVPADPVADNHLGAWLGAGDRVRLRVRVRLGLGLGVGMGLEKA